MHIAWTKMSLAIAEENEVNLTMTHMPPSGYKAATDAVIRSSGHYVWTTAFGYLNV